MKKLCISFIMIFIFCLFPGYHSYNDLGTVTNGTYVMEHVETKASLLPHVTISDDEIIFSFDPLSSYLPYGTYTINNNLLTMITDDKKYIYVFQVNGDNLIFMKNISSSVNLIDGRFGVEVTDKAKFHRKDD